MKALRSDPRTRSTPVILLAAVTQKEYIVEAAKLGARDCLMKSSFSLNELLNRVKNNLEGSVAVHTARAVASARTVGSPPQRADNTMVRPGEKTAGAGHGHPSVACPPSPRQVVGNLLELKPLVTQEEMIKILSHGLELKPLAPVVYNVMTLTSNPSCSAEDIARAVGQDQALAIRVLKLANGMTYSRGLRVNSVKDAVRRIGVRGVRDLITAIDVFQHYGESLASQVDANMFWEHSIACGCISSSLAKTCGVPIPDDYFLMGLLHDVGRLVLLEHAPEVYRKVLDCADRLALPLEVIESKLMLMDHCGILERVLNQWKFPHEFIAPIVNHHRGAEAFGHMKAEDMRAATIIALADRIAHAMLMGHSGNQTIYPFDDLAGMLKLKTADLQRMLEEISSVVMDAKLSILFSSDKDQWSSAASKLKAGMKQPIRALCVSEEPAFDAFRILFEQLADEAIKIPNLGVIYLAYARDELKMIQRYDELEKQNGDKRLPVLFIYHKGQPKLSESWFSSRKVLPVKAPVAIKVLLDSVADLIGP
jgi:HD-like signal output (HDOD) protein